MTTFLAFSTSGKNYQERVASQDFKVNDYHGDRKGSPFWVQIDSLEDLMQLQFICDYKLIIDDRGDGYPTIEIYDAYH